MPIITAQAELPKSESKPIIAPEVRQTNVVESPVEATAGKDEQLSPKFAALARKEKILIQRNRELRVREDALKAKEAEYLSAYIPKSKLKEDPMTVINEAGVTYDELVANILNQDPQSQAYKKIEQRFKELEDRQASAMKAIEEDKNRSYEQAVKQITTEATMLIDADPAYETIKEEGAADAVVELIKQTFDTSGVLMSIEDAAKEVENYLIEEGIRKANLKKVKAKLTPIEQVQEVQKQQTKQLSPQVKTLTNDMVASSKPLSDRERKQRAIMAFKGILK